MMTIQPIQPGPPSAMGKQLSVTITLNTSMTLAATSLTR